MRKMQFLFSSHEGHSVKYNGFAFPGLRAVSGEATFLLFASLLHTGLTLIHYLLMNKFIEQSRWQS